MVDDFKPFEPQAHSRFSLRSGCGGLQLRMRMSLRDLLKLLQNLCSILFFLSKLVLAHFLSFSVLAEIA